MCSLLATTALVVVSAPGLEAYAPVQDATTSVDDFLVNVRNEGPPTAQRMSDARLLKWGNRACKVYNGTSKSTASFFYTRDRLKIQGLGTKMANAVARAATTYLCFPSDPWWGDTQTPTPSVETQTDRTLAEMQSRWNASDPISRAATCAEWNSYSHSEWFSMNSIPASQQGIWTTFLNLNC